MEEAELLLRADARLLVMERPAHRSPEDAGLYCGRPGGGDG